MKDFSPVTGGCARAGSCGSGQGSLQHPSAMLPREDLESPFFAFICHYLPFSEMPTCHSSHLPTLKEPKAFGEPLGRAGCPSPWAAPTRGTCHHRHIARVPWTETLWRCAAESVSHHYVMKHCYFTLLNTVRASHRRDYFWLCSA